MMKEIMMRGKAPAPGDDKQSLNRTVVGINVGPRSLELNSIQSKKVFLHLRLDKLQTACEAFLSR
jgi:hypothetical protein